MRFAPRDSPVIIILSGASGDRSFFFHGRVGRFSFFPLSLARSLNSSFFAAKLRERAACARGDDEFDTLARVRSTVIAVSKRNARAGERRRGSAARERRIIVAVDKRYRRMSTLPIPRDRIDSPGRKYSSLDYLADSRAAYVTRARNTQGTSENLFALPFAMPSAPACNRIYRRAIAHGHISRFSFPSSRSSSRAGALSHPRNPRNPIPRAVFAALSPAIYGFRERSSTA